MSTMTPVPENHPLMVAWNAYKLTEDYANTLRWAVRSEHTEGSLWAAFEQGWRAREVEVDAARREERERSERLAKALTEAVRIVQGERDEIQHRCAKDEPHHHPTLRVLHRLVSVLDGIHAAALRPDPAAKL